MVEKTPFDPAVSAFKDVEARVKPEHVSPPDVRVNQPYAVALYQEARGSYERAIRNEWDMKNVVAETRDALRVAERHCEIVKADALLNAEDEESGIFVRAHATNDKMRRAAIDDWEQRDPYYIDAIRDRDRARNEVANAQRDLVVCIRALVVLRLDMEFAIALLRESA